MISDQDAVALPDTRGAHRDEESDAVPRRRRPLPFSLYLGGGAVAALVLFALIGPLLAQFNPIDGTGGLSLSPPSWHNLMGTDLFGRDIWTRIIYGSRIAIGMSSACVLASVAFGTLWGLIAGYSRGIVEAVMMRFVDLVISFPYIVLVIALLAVFGTGLGAVFIAIVAVDWTVYARLIHSQVLSIREREYIEACRALGMPGLRIMWKHMLPNVITAVIVYATLDISQVILTISALNFLGLGVQPPTPDWGYMVNEGRNFIYTGWWISTLPGIAVMITGLAFSLLGDGLADTLDRR